MHSASEAVIAGTLLVLAAAAAAENLSGVYQSALAADPDYLGAQAEYEAARQTVPQAQAGLLPELGASMQAEWHKQKLTRVAFNPSGGNSFTFESYNYGLNLRQPLYHRDRLVGLQQADSRLLEAGARFEMMRQGLALRAAEAYFDVLARQEELGFTRSLERSLERQLGQVNQRLQVGLGTITDVEEARAGYDLAVARGIQAMNEVAIARERLRVLTGAYTGPLHTLGEEFLPEPPSPEGAENWERMALDHSPEVELARYSLAVHKLETQRRQSGHYPVLDLVGQAGFSSTGGRFGQTEAEDIAVGVEFQLPLFQGGRVNAAAREALRLEQGARHGLEKARRQARREARESYLNVISGIGRIHALRQAVVSSETALDATRTGFEVGTRTSVDVVEAERALSEARRDYALARYDYLLASLHLRRAAGIISEQDLAHIDQWLSPPPGGLQ